MGANNGHDYEVTRRRLIHGAATVGLAGATGLAGADAEYEVRETNRGNEVVVETDPSEERTLFVRTRL